MEGCLMGTPDYELIHNWSVCIYLITFGLKCSGFISDQINLLLVSLDEG